METPNASNVASTFDGPVFVPVTDAPTPVSPTNYGAPPAPEPPPGETDDERKRRLKSERDRRYRERKSGKEGAPTPPKESKARPVQDTLDELKRKFASTPNDAPPVSQPGPGAPAFAATGEVLLGLCNATLPGLVARFASRDRATPVDADRVRLNDAQVKMLKPSAAPAEAYLLQNLHPVVIFSVSLLGAMFSNVPPRTAEDERAAREAKAAKKDKQ